jgi:hypothetical protein
MKFASLFALYLAVPVLLNQPTSDLQEYPDQMDENVRFVPEDTFALEDDAQGETELFRRDEGEEFSELEDETLDVTEEDETEEEETDVELFRRQEVIDESTEAADLF